MKTSLTLASLALLATACHSSGSAERSNSSLHIVGGSRVTNDSPAYTSTVALVASGSSIFCTGTLVADNLVVTAAHCLEDIKNPSDFKVFFGDVVTSDAGTKIDVAEFQTFKPEGSKFFPNFDIAWVKLAAPAPAPYAPIEVLRDPHRLEASSPVHLAGFGKTASNCNAQNDAGCVGEKLMVDSVLKDYLDTSRYFNLLRVGPTPNSGACNGDSGGPAYVRLGERWYLVGATNGGNFVLTPEMFTNIARSCEAGVQVYTFVGGYVDWLEETSGVTLAHDGEGNAAPELRRSLAPIDAQPSTFAEWYAYDNHERSGWYTVDRMLDVATRAAQVHPEDAYAFFQDPVRVEQVLEDKKSLTLVGASFDFGSFSLQDEQLTDIAPITTIEGLEELKLIDHALQDTMPLEKLKNLKRLSIVGNKKFASDTPVAFSTAFLAGLPQLESLDLSDNIGLNLDQIPWESLGKLESLEVRSANLTSVDWAARIPSLKRLIVSKNAITSIAALAPLTSLEELDVSSNAITDFSVISNLASLKILRANENPVDERVCTEGAECSYSPSSDASFAELCRYGIQKRSEWSEWQNIQTLLWAAGEAHVLPDDAACQRAETTLQAKSDLNLRSSSMPLSLYLSSVAALASFPNIESLDIYGNYVRDLSPLAKLPKLKRLIAKFNHISNLSPLGDMKSLVYADVSSNPVSTLDGLTSATLVELRADDILQMRALTLGDLSGLTALETLDLPNRRLTDVAPLAVLSTLKYLNLNGNLIRSVAPLAALTGLEELTAYRNALDSYVCPLVHGLCFFDRHEAPPRRPGRGAEPASDDQDEDEDENHIPPHGRPSAPVTPREPPSPPLSFGPLPQIAGSSIFVVGSGKTYR